MQRQRRIAWNGLVAMAALLSLAACWLWAASIGRNDVIGWAGWRNQQAGNWQAWGGESRRHQLILFHFVGKWKIQNPSHVDGDDSKIQPGYFHQRYWPGQTAIRSRELGPLAWAGLGMRTIGAPPGVKPITLYVVAVPYWLIAFGLGALPAYAAVARIRRRRRERAVGLCRACGYDLRATPQKCPECGTVREKVESPEK